MKPLARRSLIGALIVLALLAVLCAFVAFVLPGIVRAQAQKAGTEALHRRLVIDAVHINPLTLRVEVDGVRLMEPDGTTPFAAVDQLEVRLAWSSVTHLAPVVREVRVEHPFVHWARTGPGHFSTDDIVAALAQPAAGAPTPKAASGALPRFAIHNIRIENGHFEFDDQPRGAQHLVDRFSLGVPFISTFRAEEEVFVEPHLAAVIDGAELSLNGKALPFAPVPEFSLDMDFDDIDLARAMEWLPPPAPVDLRSGRLDVHAHLTAHLPHGEAPHAQIALKTSLRQLDVAQAAGRPRVHLDKVDLDVAQAGFPGGPLAVTLTVNDQGRLAVQGDLALSPLQANIDYELKDLNLLPLWPLAAEHVNLRLTRAILAAKGKIHLAQDDQGGLTGDATGDVGLARVATIDAVNGNDFVNWDGLDVRGIKAHWAPAAAPSMRIDEVALRNFYARIILSAQGRLNLQDIVRGRAEAQRSLTDASAQSTALATSPERSTADSQNQTGASASQTATHAEATGPGQGASSPASNASAPPAKASRKAAAPPPNLAIGKVVLTGGHVRYTDNFIQPRYSADLANLGGTITGLSPNPESTATVDLKGSVNDAPLTIAGALNPLRAEPYLDIRGNVHDMELAPLTPYSAKYVGYRIERGKLSFDVAYHLDGRQLKADNHLVLDQLTFGERVQSASATSLPVLLAVALLKDRNGVIDINLPIGGSLDDPQFSVGHVIVQVLVNLVTKAVTAPFSLLANLFGGSEEELGWAAFAPGDAAVSPQAQTRLQSLAKALSERPGLKMDIRGQADPVADREQLGKAKLRSQALGLKRKDLAGKSGAGTEEVTVSDQEYPALIGRLYAALPPPGGAGSPGAAGAPPQPAPTAGSLITRIFHKNQPKPPPAPAVPLEQMEKALIDASPVSDDDLVALANRRAQAAKAWFVTVGAIPEERLALVGAQLPRGELSAAQPTDSTRTPAAGSGPDSAAARPGTRVEFSLR